MKNLFDGWTWGAMTVKNVVAMRHGTVRNSVEKRFTDQYLLGIKLTGEASVIYRDESIDYSAGTALFLPKEENKNFEYYTSATESGRGVIILFDSDTLLSRDPQHLSGIDQNVKNVALKLLNLYNRPDRYSPPEVMSAFYELLSLLYKESIKQKRTKFGDDRFSPALKYIDEHIFDGYIDIQVLADMCSMTEKYFRNSFKKAFGLPPLKYINTVKANHIKMLIMNDEFSIGEVAKMTGFSDLNYFSRFFKNHFGTSISEYRRNLIIKM